MDEWVPASKVSTDVTEEAVQSADITSVAGRKTRSQKRKHQEMFNLQKVSQHGYTACPMLPEGVYVHETGGCLVCIIVQDMAERGVASRCGVERWMSGWWWVFRLHIEPR